MKKIIFYFVVALSLLFASCKKADLNSSNWDWDWGGIGTIKFNSNSFDTSTLAYIKIPANRYFIYKDGSTGSFDSVYVSQSTIYPVFVPAASSTPAFFYETFSLSLMYPTGGGIDQWLTGFAGCDSVYRSVPLFIDPDFILSNTQTNLPCFWSPFTSSGFLQYSFMPSLSIEGILYNSVHIFSATNGLQPTQPNYLETTHYWVKGIGIIKKEIRTYNSTKTSLLVRFG